jgi:hypothetical protein
LRSSAERWFHSTRDDFALQEQIEADNSNRDADRAAPPEHERHTAYPARAPVRADGATAARAAPLNAER